MHTLRKMTSSYLMGEELLLVECAEILLNKGHQVLGIISPNHQILEWAGKHDIPSTKPNADLLAFLSQRPFDYFFSITNLSIIPEEILSLPRQCAINFHDGLLPYYAGLHCPSWAILRNEPTHGITWHVMTSEVDKGGILKQVMIPIQDDDTAFTLNVKCHAAGLTSFGDLIDELVGKNIQPQSQNGAGGNYFSKYQRPPATVHLAWDSHAAEWIAAIKALDFGSYTNPLGLPKILVGDTAYIVTDVEKLNRKANDAPGTVTQISDYALQVALADHEIAIRSLMRLDGSPVAIKEWATALDLHEGDVLPQPDAAVAQQWLDFYSQVARHEPYWVHRLAAHEGLEHPYAKYTQEAEDRAFADVAFDVPQDIRNFADEYGYPLADVMLTAWFVYLARVTGVFEFDMGYILPDPDIEYRLFAQDVPLRIRLDPSADFAGNLQLVMEQLSRIQQKKTFARDIFLRYPTLKAKLLQGWRFSSPIAVATDDFALGSLYNDMILMCDHDQSKFQLLYNIGVFDDASVTTIVDQFVNVLRYIGRFNPKTIAQVPLMTEAMRRQILVDWNATYKAYDRTLCIHDLFEKQAQLQPNKTAVVFQDTSLTFQELNQVANQLARHLQSFDVAPETLVGIYMEPSLELVIAILAVLKAGAAYVPMDPAYPADRIAFIAKDANVQVVLTQEALAEKLPTTQAEVVCVDRERAHIAEYNPSNVQSGVTSDNLCYLIYTSGSTGKPKGVMVQHRNVVNFFAGMDDCIPYDDNSVWLSVTSLSFDISVLELLWTLTRGIKVVLQENIFKQSMAEELSPAASRPVEFSLFYFSSDAGDGGSEQYALLLEGAKFADQHGFSSVWTPERHFHAFGGLYPNPSVISAAIAALTHNVKIRAGSCVLPLHSPIRVAEEWAVVDNLSGGRVGISFAAGWQPNDFVLQPSNFANRKAIMFQNIETVRRLWRGETLEFAGADGNTVQVRTLPRPIQPELPVWVTAANNPETFRMAAENGYFLLTHLLGQNMTELAEKVALYRQVWAESGHHGRGHVTLMVHTFVGDDVESVRRVVREPMKEYLRSAVELIRQAAWSFPTFKQKADQTGRSPLDIFDNEDLTDEEMEALLEHAFNRYFETSGLFGTPESCLKMVNDLKGADIDEIACLIDFGVEAALVLEHLHHLNTLKDKADAARLQDFSVPAQIVRHAVTHLQCTPSMASILIQDPSTRSAMYRLQQVMIGGEAFPAALANELQGLISGSITNMYGPTETTIWSTTYRLAKNDQKVPIGRPIANTSIYILDDNFQPVPVGVPGELFIGGDGVVRGYLNRPELTSERFIRNPFSDDPQERMYRTGDLARYLPDGNIEFLGRMDFQVKIRGYRIELGEIEACLNDHPAVREAVVVASEDRHGDKLLVAFLIPEAEPVPSSELRDHLMKSLPEFMIPSHFIALDSFPLTPNAKTDRKALAALFKEGVPAPTETAASGNLLEMQIAEIWRELLNVPQVSEHDNFFEIGGHSLLAVRLHRRLSDSLDLRISIADVFRYPTIRALVDHCAQII